MDATFMKKKQEDAAKQRSMKEYIVSTDQIHDNDKFTLKAYNWLAHDHEISGLFAASMLLKLLEFYTLYRLKLIGMLFFALYKCFPSIIFGNLVENDQAVSYHHLGNSNNSPSTSFDDYQ